MNAKPQILYISSASLTSGPGAIGWDHVSILKDAGYEVDVLTLYSEPSLPEVKNVKENSIKVSFLSRLLYMFKKLLDNPSSLFLSKKLPGPPHYFFYEKEEYPPVPVSDVLSKVTKQYDLVMIYFWQEMLSFKTVEALYDHLHKPIVFFLSPDFSVMSGGCHFPCDCQRFQTGCGKCPALDSNDENDFTHSNINYRKRFYEKVKPIVFGNSYMNAFYRKSYLLNNARLVIQVPSINSTKYIPINKAEARRIFGIKEVESFIIGFGCQELSNPRKGIDYLVEALAIFRSHLSELEVENILLLVAGQDYDTIKNRLPFHSMSVGYLPIERMSEYYSAANIFVCSSVDDAGPSMVAQSISCGTPVVGFKMGAMLDVVFDKGTGYCADLKNSQDLARGIEKFYRLPKSEYDSVSMLCRTKAITEFTAENKIQQWLDVYEKYKEK